MTPKQAGIPHISADGGQSYRIGPYILESHTWLRVQQEGDEFFYFRGHVITDLDHDLMVFLHPYHQVQVTASVYDEFAKMRDPLPRWTRTRWLGEEYVKGSLRNGLLNISLYDCRADRWVSPTCRGIKKITRVLARREYRLAGTEEAYRQAGLED